MDPVAHLDRLTRDDLQDPSIARRLYLIAPGDPALLAAVVRLYPEISPWFDAAVAGAPAAGAFGSWPPIVRHTVWTTVARCAPADPAVWLRTRRLAAELMGAALEAAAGLRGC